MRKLEQNPFTRVEQSDKNTLRAQNMVFLE